MPLSRIGRGNVLAGAARPSAPTLDLPVLTLCSATLRHGGLDIGGQTKDSIPGVEDALR